MPHVFIEFRHDNEHNFTFIYNATNREALGLITTYVLLPLLITGNEIKFKPLAKTPYLLFRSQGCAKTGTRSGNIVCLTQSSNDVSERTLTFERVLLQKQEEGQCFNSANGVTFTIF